VAVNLFWPWQRIDHPGHAYLHLASRFSLFGARVQQFSYCTLPADQLLHATADQLLHATADRCTAAWKAAGCVSGLALTFAFGIVMVPMSKSTPFANYE
jgi:hypothetical protein